MEIINNAQESEPFKYSGDEKNGRGIACANYGMRIEKCQ